MGCGSTNPPRRRLSLNRDRCVIELHTGNWGASRSTALRCFVTRRRNSCLAECRVLRIPLLTEVTSLLSCLLAPLSDMHRCSASSTAATPFGCTEDDIASTSCDVSRSWTWGLWARMSSALASLLAPKSLPDGIYPMCATPKKGRR